MVSSTRSGLLGLAAVLMVAVLASRSQFQAPFFAPLDASGSIPYHIAPIGDGNEPGDKILAEWALAAWQKAAGGVLEFESSAEEESLLRLYWGAARAGRYGEMRPFRLDGKRGAAVFVLTELNGLGAEIGSRAEEDPLFRDTIVYLTCLHELGHGLGLEHTDNYDDIMFFFGYGGDIPNYFLRYRKELESRQDIPKHSGLSELDVRRIRRLYPKTFRD